MKKALLTTIFFCAALMVAAQNFYVTAPTLRNDNLKGPVRAVLTTTVNEVEEGDEYGSFQVENNSYDTAGRLLYSIYLLSSGSDGVTTFDYDSQGKLIRVSARYEPTYTETYHYNDSGQLESIEYIGHEQEQSTYHVVKRDNMGRPLLIEETPLDDSLHYTESYEYCVDGYSVTERNGRYGIIRRTYYNINGTKDSVVTGQNFKETYIYNANGNLLEERVDGMSNYPDGAVVTYRYPEEEWLTDRHGNWTTRYITGANGNKIIEMRTIIYYE